MEMNMTRIQRKQQRKKAKYERQRQQEQRPQKGRQVSKVSQDLTLIEIEGKTRNQDKALDIGLDSDNFLVMKGLPGTGKTLLGLYIALTQLEEDDEIRRVIIVRSTVSVRDPGFLPGGAEEKSSVYEAPYEALCTQLYNRGDAYKILKQKGQVMFTSTAFLRGQTFDNAVILVDEAQNMSDSELHTIMTRVGDDSRLIILGDTGQDDLTSERFKEYSGFSHLLRVLVRIPSVSIVEFGVDDIVRSGFVRDYIIAKDAEDNPRL